MSNEALDGTVRIETIVSGGQTGVDRAALDAALTQGVDVGGWCPRGRRAEDGRIPDRYPLRETPSQQYTERTVWNVRDSDATLVLTTGEPAGGTLLTLEEARRQGKPHVIVDPLQGDIELVRGWWRDHAVEILNIAGPRESENAGIYDAAYGFLSRLLAK